MILETRHLRLVEVVVVMRPDHPLAARPYVAAEDFADEHLIIYSAPGESTVFRRVLLPAGIMPRRVSHIQLTEAIVEMVKGGMGISVLARWAVLPHVAAGTLEALPLTRTGLHRQWKAAVIRGVIPEYIAEFARLVARGPAMRQQSPARLEVKRGGADRTRSA